MKDWITLLFTMRSQNPPTMSSRIVALSIGLLFNLGLVLVGVLTEHTVLAFFGGIAIPMYIIVIVIVAIINYRQNGTKW